MHTVKTSKNSFQIIVEAEKSEANGKTSKELFFPLRTILLIPTYESRKPVINRGREQKTKIKSRESKLDHQ